MNDLTYLQQNSSLLDLIPGGALIVNRHFTVLFWNETLVGWTGISKEEITGKNLGDYFPHFKQEKYLSLLKNSFDHGVPAFLSSYFHPHLIPSLLSDGTHRFQETSVVAIENPDRPGYQALLSIKDVTRERIRLKEYRSLHLKLLRSTGDLRKSNLQLKKLSLAIEHSFSSVLITDKDGKIQYVNPRFCEDSGYSSDEIIGETPGILKSGKHPREFYRDLWETVLSGKEWRGDICNKRKTGELYWNYKSITPILNSDGEVTGFVAVGIDNTEKKQAEQELQRHRDHLEELVEERTVDLQKVQEQLIHTEKLSALGKLVGSVAHEFNNPLYGLGNVIRLIDEEADLTEEQRELTALGIKECDRMASLIRRLQDFYKPSAGVASLLDVHKVIDDVVLLMNKALKEKGVKLEKIYCDNLPQIEAVGDQLKQVFLNLIQNAQEAILKGGGTISISTEGVGSSIRVKIQDTGQGMSREQMKFIFEPFYSTRGIKGTGLGLSVSYGIIKKHGGDIEVASIPERGSTFTITLPVKGAVR